MLSQFLKSVQLKNAIIDNTMEPVYALKLTDIPILRDGIFERGVGCKRGLIDCRASH